MPGRVWVFNKPACIVGPNYYRVPVHPVSSSTRIPTPINLILNLNSAKSIFFEHCSDKTGLKNFTLEKIIGYVIANAESSKKLLCVKSTVDSSQRV